MTNTKPHKPTPDFPLFPHNTGRWAKKVKGKMTYWGPWNDPDGALQRYLASLDTKIQGKSAASKVVKPEKPTGSPLFAHDCGQWAFKIGGKTRYCGPWTDHDAALLKYEAIKSGDIEAGGTRQSADVGVGVCGDGVWREMDRRDAYPTRGRTGETPILRSSGR